MKILQISQYIFEETFNLRFKIPFSQNEDTYSKSTLDKVSPSELKVVRKANALDLELYEFAEQLIHTRFNELKIKDPSFEEHYNSLGQQRGYHFSWDDIEKED
jgi:heparan sulfate 6-O-sulfotransferase HS6ST1